MKTLPNFFIVGAARSGTSSLDRYLSQHPDIYITSKKETHFFAHAHFPPCLGPGDERLSKLLIRDEDQYTQLFAEAVGKKAVGESSAFYLVFPGAAERIAQAIPDAKIIIILREPVDRAHSAYTLMVRDGRETRSFEEGLRQEEERKQKGFEPIWWYKDLGLYFEQVKHYLEVFGRRQVQVLLYDKLFAHPGQGLRDIFKFLEVNEDVVIDTSVTYNVSGVPKSRKLYTLLDNVIFTPNALEKRVKSLTPLHPRGAGVLRQYITMEKRIRSLIPLHLRMAWASKITSMVVERVSMDTGTRAQLKAYFAEDVKKLEDLLHRDLRHWY
jgi:Sulfotransferase family